MISGDTDPDDDWDDDEGYGFHSQEEYEEWEREWHPEWTTLVRDRAK